MSIHYVDYDTVISISKEDFIELLEDRVHMIFERGGPYNEDLKALRQQMYNLKNPMHIVPEEDLKVEDFVSDYIPNE